MALARPGTARGSGRPLGRLLPAAAFGLFCFVLGTRLSPAVKQASTHAASAADNCRALARAEQRAKPCNVEQPGGGASTAAPDSAAVAAASPYDVPINVARLLGEAGTAAGVLYTPYMCLPPWSQGIGDASLLRALRGKLTAALVEWLRQLAPAGADDSRLRGTPLFPLLGLQGVQDPLLAQLDRQLSDLLSRFLLHATGSRVCACGAQVPASAEARVKSADEVGTTGCPEGQDEPDKPGFACSGSMLGLLGYTGATWSVDTLVDEVATKGICSSLVTEPTFGLWWIRERLNKAGYRAFKVDQPDEDTLLELFDLL